MIEIHIPKMGMSTVEVDVVSVLVAIGDIVASAQVLAEVEAEKASVEIESPVTGRVAAVYFSAGATAQVGDVIFGLEEG